MQAKGNNKAFSDQLKRRIYKFILALIAFIDTLPKNDPLCRIAIDQLIRSGTSLGANYIEVIAGSSRKDFTNFLSHALKSANESKFWLALLRDSGRCDQAKVEPLLSELIEIANIFASSIRTLKHS